MLPAFEVLLFGSVLTERLLLKGNPLANMRRLTAVAFTANLIWLIASLFSLTAPPKRQHFIILGLFLASAFNLLVLASVFFSRFSAALAVSLLHPFSTVLILNPSLMENPYQYVWTMTTGVVIITTVFIYLLIVNRSGKRYLAVPPLTFLQAFLKAWASGRPEEIEAIIEKTSTEDTVTTSLIHLHRNSRAVSLVIPGVHPGPMYPIGSWNLPYQLFQHFAQKGYAPLIFHGISDHELNLTSSKTVERYLDSINETIFISTGSTCSKPLTSTHGKATVKGIAFGEVALITITMAPYGSEDFPREVRQKITHQAAAIKFKDVFIVDAHNSLGAIPDEEECAEAVEASEKLLAALKKAPQYPFQIGYAHSLELNIKFDDDVGPAGIGATIIQVNGEKHVLIVADSNNATLGVRERILEHYKDSPNHIVEICTSDTHFSAGQEMSIEGYSPLGGKTPIQRLVAIIDTLIEKASNNLQSSNYMCSRIESTLKVFGRDALNNFSAALDSVSKTAKLGGLTVIIISIAALLAVLIT